MIKAIADRLALDLPELKEYLKIDHIDEDLLLADILAAAKTQADVFCQNEFTHIDEMTGEERNDPIPADVKIAVLRIAAALYESRSDHISGVNVAGISLQAGQIEWNAQRLLQPYKRFFAV